jgi:hypothetical protein
LVKLVSKQTIQTSMGRFEADAVSELPLNSNVTPSQTSKTGLKYRSQFITQYFLKERTVLCTEA